MEIRLSHIIAPGFAASHRAIRAGALELLESLSGRKACDEILEKFFGQVDFHTDPRSAEYLLAFRQEVNAAIEKAL